MANPRPKKVLFVHTPKAAGVYLIEYFRTRLGYARTQSTKQTDSGVWLDFTPDELLEHLDDEGFINTHVLSAGWSDLVALVPAASTDEIVRTIRAFRARGWFVFTFVRHPGEHLCSFYHYVLDAQRRGWHESVRLHAPAVDRTLEAFVSEHCERELLPAYWRELDFAGLASDENLAAFFARHFDHAFEPRAMDAHASGSRGYAHYCGTGEISAETQARIEASTNMAIYREIAGRRDGDGE